MENTAIVAMSGKDMTKALIINKRVNDTFLSGYLLAQGNELRKRMRTSVVEFYFTKKNGCVRRAFGTTMPSLAKAHTIGGHPSSTKVITFFDVEKSAWRSCQIHSLLKVC